MTIVTFYMYMHIYVVRTILKYHSIISQVQISLVLLVMELVEGGCLDTHTLPIHIRYGYKILYIVIHCQMLVCMC